MIRHILFDCFGTLIQTGSGSVEATREILRAVGSRADPSAFYQDWKAEKRRRMEELPFANEKTLFAQSLTQTFRAYGIEADGEREAGPMIRWLFGTRPLFPEVRETLERLDGMGQTRAVASNTDTDSLMHYLRQNGLCPDRIFTSEDLRVYKPRPEFYRAILDRTGWAAEECLFVGDSLEEDVLGPQSEGIPGVLVARQGRYARGDWPFRVIRSLGELPALLERQGETRFR